ncbi:MAG: tetratricopeptide repeat protein [Bacteroidales bacterium]
MKVFLIAILIIHTIILNITSQSITETSVVLDMEETGDYRQALEIAKNNLEKDSLNVKLWYEMGRLLRLNQQYKLAINVYQKARQLDPTNPFALLYLAKTNKLAGNRDLAIKTYKEFLLIQPFNTLALVDLSSLYSSIDQYDSAAIYAQRLYNTDVLNVDYLQKLASYQWFSKKKGEAFLNYKKAFKMDSTYLPVVFDLARIYINLRQQDSAIAILKGNLTVHPQEARLYNDIGTAYFSKGDYYMAIDYYEKAIGLNYSSLETYRRLGISYYSCSRFELAEKMLNKLIQDDTTDYKICIYLGKIHKFNTNYDKAILFYNIARNLITPDSIMLTAIYMGLSECYGEKKEFIKQIEAIQLLHLNTPVSYQSSDYLKSIAEIYENDIKDTKKALSYYQEYYDSIKNLKWYEKEKKDEVLLKINKLKAIKN